MRQRIVHRLVASDFQSALPRALDQQLRRRNHEEEINRLTEARQQIAPRFVRTGSEAVKAESVDQQVRHVAEPVLARHVSIQLLIDDLDFLTRKRTGVFVDRAQRSIIEQLLDRKSTRLNSSHGYISYAVFCLKKKKKTKYIIYLKKKKKQKQSLYI